MNSDFDVVVVGLNVVDLLMVLPTEVCPGEKHKLTEIVLQGGAPAGNAACVIASLGWSTAMVARMGRNPLSELSRADFVSRGVLPDLFIDDHDSQPALAVVQISPHDGSRTVFYSLNGYRPLTADDVPEQAIQSARLVVTDGYESAAAIRALSIAREHNIASLVDIEDGDLDDLLNILELSTHAILPLAAGKKISGREEVRDVLQGLRQISSAQLVVTDGERGSWAWTPSGVHHQPATATDVVDTTGCGDAYHGGYASGLLCGQSLEERMSVASYVASRVATGLGGRTNVPTRRALEKVGYRWPATSPLLLKESATP